MTEGLVQYVCERCHTRFVLALSGRKLSPANQMRAGVEAARHTVLRRDGSYTENLAEATRRLGQVLADAEYERFRRSFNFCHNCRQFVCSDCWNDTQRQCLTCAPRKAVRVTAGARAARGPLGPTLEPDGPQINRPLAGGLVMAASVAGASQAGGRLTAADTDASGSSRTPPRSLWPARTTMVLAAMVLVLVTINLSSWQLGNAPLSANAADSGTPTASLVAVGPTGMPTSSTAPRITLDPRVSTVDTSPPEPTATPTHAPTAAPTPRPTPAPTPPQTPKPTVKPTTKPTPTPKPTSTPTIGVTISCTSSTPGRVDCTSTVNVTGATYAWTVNGSPAVGGSTLSFTGSSNDQDLVVLTVTKAGYLPGHDSKYVTVS